MKTPATALALPPWFDALLEAMLGMTPKDIARRAGVVDELRAISKLFTSGRERGTPLPPYLSKPASAAAYFAYYSTANCLKLTRPLDELRASGFFTGREELRVLDVGCGPGTSLLGLAAWLSRNSDHVSALQRLHVNAIDRSTAALAWTTNVHAFLAGRALPAASSLETRHSDLNKSLPGDERHDLIILMNVLNEIDAPAALLAALATQLAEQGSVLIIEPALRAVSRELLALRADAIAQGWTVYAPCFRQGDCPALEHENDWCHDELPWQRPSWYEALDDALGNVKHSLKYSSLLLNRHVATLAAALGEASPRRVVSEAMREKGRMRMFVCGEGGRVACMRNTRDASDANRDCDALTRYDIIDVRDEQIRPHDVLIAAETRVRRIPV